MGNSFNYNYLPALTGVRAIAAYMVFIHHFNPFPAGIIHDFFNEFHVGVTIFFVLSGFLIALRYYEMKPVNYRSYIINRIARIYPMYFFLTTITFLYFVFTGQNKVNEIIPLYIFNITFIRGFFDDFKFSGIAQGWSLTVEEMFYFLAPLFFLLIRKKNINIFLLPVSIMILGIILIEIFKHVNFYGFLNSYDLVMNYTFFGRCFEFFIGIGLYLVLKNKLIKTPKHFMTYTGIIAIGICIYFLSTLKGDYDTGVRTSAGKLINTFILPLCGIAVFFYGLITERTFLSKILGNRLFDILGKSSYTFYLVHMGVFVSLFTKISSNYFFLFIFLNVLSIILYKLIEVPSNRIVKSFFT